MKLVKDADALEALMKTKQGINWICGPIKTGNKATDHIPKDAIAYTFVMYSKPKRYKKNEAMYQSISGSYYYLLARSLTIEDVQLGK